MTDPTAPGPETEIKVNAEVHAVIIRADGTREDLGVIEAHYDSPFKRGWWNLVGSRVARHRITRANTRARALKEQ